MLSGLPLPLTRLLGRAQEVEEGERLLHNTQVRLLTVTGTGGVGKTRTALRWLPGALQRFESMLSDAPFVELPFDENARSLGPANSWVHEARERLQQSRTPLPMAELREVLRFPQHLRQVSAQVRVPVQMTIGEYDTIWESSASALDELSQLFPYAPFVEVRRQRFLPHQPGAHLAARAFYLRELAFVEECRVHHSMIVPEPLP